MEVVAFENYRKINGFVKPVDPFLNFTLMASIKNLEQSFENNFYPIK